ncbi:hypothetical protein BANRA_00005 [Escherichia coli]|nr:hypothetical protein BANRA_00005 [Escherichia coli]
MEASRAAARVISTNAGSKPGTHDQMVNMLTVKCLTDGYIIATISISGMAIIHKAVTGLMGWVLPGRFEQDPDNGKTNQRTARITHKDFVAATRDKVKHVWQDGGDHREAPDCEAGLPVEPQNHTDC